MRKPHFKENKIRGFWRRVQKTESCWYWMGCISDGYGLICIRPYIKGVSKRAHIFSWELVNGKVPEGKILHHTCRNRECVNPDHLVLTTQKEHASIDPGVGSGRLRKLHKLNNERKT